MSNETAKTCPFCGHRPKLRRADNHADWWILGCVSAECDFKPEIQHVDKQYAVRRWNKRP